MSPKTYSGATPPTTVEAEVRDRPETTHQSEEVEVRHRTTEMPAAGLTDDQRQQKRHPVLGAVKMDIPTDTA